jgi:Protein of unknown function (DUF4230)
MDSYGSLYLLLCSCSSATATSTMPGARGRHRRRNRWMAGQIILALTLTVVWLLTRRPPVLVGTSSGPTIQQIQALSELVTARVTIADARETTLSGYLGDVKALLVVRGDALLGPDLSQARIVSCDNSTKVMVVELPRPRLISSRLDHSATRVVSLSHDGLWVIVPGDAGRTAVLNRAYAEAEKAVAEAAVTSETVNEAAEHARHALGAFFGTAGWDVQVRWVPD